MDRLTYPRKFALVSLLFVLPLAAVMYFLMAEINSRVEFARKELDGTRYLRAVRTLQHQVGQGQHLAALYAQGKTTVRPELIRQQAEIDDALARLEAVGRDLGAGLNTDSWLAVVRENRRFLREALFGKDGSNAGELHKQLLTDVAKLNAHVGDTSNLILDPDLDSYYLMDTVLLKLPATADLLVELRLLVTAAGRGMLRVEARAEVVRLAALIEAEAGHTRDALKVAYANTQAPQMSARLGLPAGNYDRSVVRLVAGLRGELVTAPDLGPVAVQLDSLISEVTQASLALGDSAFTELDELLVVRIAGFERQKRWTLLFSVASLLLLAYLLTAFYASVMSIVQRLRAASERMSSGDFQDTLTLETRDELGQVANAFNTVALRLREEKHQADEESRRARAAEAEVREHEQQLLASREEALQAAKAKASFLATMSHEIRTPLNGVVGMSTLLAETRLDDEQRDYLQTIRLSSDQLLAVINDILDFSKIESGKLDLESEPLSPRSAVEEACDIAAPRAREKSLELIIDVPETTDQGLPAVPAAIAGDITRIRQVLINLIDNAIKFTEKGEVAVSVRKLERGMDPGSKPDCAVLEFRVTDTGIGIPADCADALFQAFMQVDTSTTRKYGGTGLGLAICKRLVELMGGQIGADSVPGQGSSFWFTVPAPLAQLPAMLGAVDAMVLQGRHALVVEDHETNVRVLTRQLELWGMRVSSAESGHKALQALALAQGEGRLPDIIITDMHMPEMDGVSLARAIKENTSWSEVPLVLLTSGFMPPGHEAAQLFAARLLKPTRQKQLFDTVARCISTQGGKQVVADSQLAQSTLTPKNSTVLVVDDNAVNLKVACAMLNRLGYQAQTALDGQAAVEAVARAHAAGLHFGAVLMDVNMPRMNGLKATDEIHLLLGQQSPPIIALTAAASTEDRDRCMDAGMNDYLAKPLHFGVLAQMLEHWLSVVNQPVKLVKSSQPSAGIVAVSPVLMDFDRLAQFKEFDDDDLSITRDAIAFFMTDAPQRLEAIEQAIRVNDSQALSWASHALAGAACNVGAVAMQSVAIVLETEAKRGTVPINAAQELKKLQSYWLKTHTLLETWLWNGSV